MGPQTFDLKLPDIGEGVAEGEIVRWLVNAGDTVREDQPLVEVMTDKATVEIPSPRAGVVAALHAEAGQVVPVGTVIVSIAAAGDAGPEPAAARGSAAQAHAGGERAGDRAGAALAADAASASEPREARKVQALPAVRQLARKLGVEIERVVGSGPGGRITAEDVERAATGAPHVATVNPGGAHAPATDPAAAGASAQPPAAPGVQRIPLRGLRRRIAQHMRHSLDTAAHFTFVAECDFTALVAHRERMKARAEAAGIKLTYLAYVARALAEPLRQFPYLNATLDDERGEIVLLPDLHLGIATHTPEGLTVAVIRDAGSQGLFTLAREIARLAEAARTGHLALDELQGGTFTVTSTGTHGGVLATPILHHPQVGILGVHAITKKPAVVNDRIEIRQLGNLSLSLDHRVVDGAVGADFLYALIARLEHVERWLTEGDLA
jgi:pyruvate dehydrogenase E2 component (dihydrolipoyllysine-residue acetyltransferase)